MKTILRRLQQLEQRHSESLAANGASGARDRILARINGLAERLRGDANWEAMQKPSLEDVRQRVREALSHHKGEAKPALSRSLGREERPELSVSDSLPIKNIAAPYP